jgi:hypothetical protein
VPLSVWQGMEDCLATIVARRPAAVLDAGIGFGLWGVLLRQYLDVWSGRIQADEWVTRIDGIEIDPRRVQAHALHVYDEILIGDVRELVPRRAAERRYEVILFGDILEHLPKSDGRALLDIAVRLAADVVVVRIPLGDGWRREGREDPDHHRSQWYADDFADVACTLHEYDFMGNPYGLVVIDARAQAIADAEARLRRLEDRVERLATP